MRASRPVTTALAGLGLVVGLGGLATPVLGQAAPAPAPLPQASELVGTWVGKVNSMDFGADTGRGRRLDICGKPGRCTMTTYDTLVFQADSTLLHKVIQVYPAKPDGVPSGTAVPKMRWWIASDTLWTEWEMTMNGKPVKYVYNSDGKRVPAEPVKQATTQVQLKDGGKTLVFWGQEYQRATPAAP